MACTTCKHVLAASKTVTECMCLGDGPVYCRLHQMEKTAHFHSLCQRSQPYFQAWSEGRLPGHLDLSPREDSAIPLGTWLASTIKLVTLGKVNPCTGCKSRMAKLNHIGAKIAGLFHARK